MRSLTAAAALLAVSGLAAVALARTETPGPVWARVVEVHDGDTITVEAEPWPGDRKLTDARIDGIDAPETRGACPDAGRAARDYLAGLVAGKRVVLTEITPDKYGTRVHAFPVRARIFVDGRDVAAEMIRAGMARAYSGRGRAGWCP